MKIVGQAFFINQKVDFLKFSFSNFLGCVHDRTQVTKPMVYSKLESPVVDRLPFTMHWKLSELCQNFSKMIISQNESFQFIGH